MFYSIYYLLYSVKILLASLPSQTPTLRCIRRSSCCIAGHLRIHPKSPCKILEILCCSGCSLCYGFCINRGLRDSDRAGGGGPRRPRAAVGCRHPLACSMHTPGAPSCTREPKHQAQQQTQSGQKPWVQRKRDSRGASEAAAAPRSPYLSRGAPTAVPEGTPMQSPYLVLPKAAIRGETGI